VLPSPPPRFRSENYDLQFAREVIMVRAE